MATSKQLQTLAYFLRLYRFPSPPKNLTAAAGSFGHNTATAGSKGFLQLRRRLPNTPNQLILSSGTGKYTTRMVPPGQPPAPQGSSSKETSHEIDDSSEPPPLPPSPSPPPPSGPLKRAGWMMKWAIGSILSLVISFWFPKWTMLLRIGGQAEVVMEEVEQATEVIEKVANVVEKVSQDMGDQLPDHSKLKQATLMVEIVSKEAAKDACYVEDFIHKVDKLEHDIGDMENMTKPVIKKIVDDIRNTQHGSQQQP